MFLLFSCMLEDLVYNEIIVESFSFFCLYICFMMVKVEERCLRQLLVYMFCRVGQGDLNDWRGDVFVLFVFIFEKVEMFVYFGQFE